MSKENELDIYKQEDKLVSPEVLEAQFKHDTAIVAEQSAHFIKELHPAYLYNTKQEIINLSCTESMLTLLKRHLQILCTSRA